MNDSRRYGVKIIACELGFCKLVVSSIACFCMLRFVGEERFSFIFKGEARYVAEFLNDIYIYRIDGNSPHRRPPKQTKVS